MPLDPQKVTEFAAMHNRRVEEDLIQPPVSRVAPPVGPEGPRVYESLGAAIAGNGIITGMARALEEDGTPEWDRNWSMDQSMQDPEVAAFINEMLASGDSAVLGSLGTAGSHEEILQIIRQTEKARERNRIAAANGALVNFAGAMMGVGIDALVTLPLTMGAGGVSSAAMAARTAGAQRALGAARVGAVGAAEGALERGVQARTDPTIGIVDIVAESGLGGVFGAGIGTLAPRIVGGVGLQRVKRGEDIVTKAQLDEIVDPLPEAVGAAAAPPDIPSGARPAFGAQSVVGRIFRSKRQGTRLTFLSNPRRVMVDFMARARKHADETGDPSLAEVGDRLSAIIRTSEVREEEIGGAASRTVSYQDRARDMRVIRAVREKSADANYRAMRADVFDPNIVQKIGNIGPKFLRTMPTQVQFEQMARLAHLRKTDPEQYGEMSILDADPTWRETVDEDTLDRMLPHLEKEGALDQKYYDDFVEPLREAGLIDDKDVIELYTPQSWDTAAIEGNPVAFSHVLRTAILRMGPNDEFLANAGLLRTVDDEQRAIDLQNQLDEITEKPAPKSPQGQTSRDKAVQKRQAELDAIEKKWGSVEDLRKGDPELYVEYKDIWDAQVHDMATEAAEQSQRQVQAELDILAAKTVEEAYEKTTRTIETRQASLERAMVDLKKLGKSKKTADQRTKLATRIARLERQIANETEKLDALNRALGNTKLLREAAEKFGSRGRKRGLAKQARRLDKAEARTISRVMARTIEEEVTSIRNSILGEKALGGQPPAFVEQSGRFKRRYLHLGTAEFDPEVRQFLRENREELRASYQQSAGNHLALRQALGEPKAGRGNDANEFIAGHKADLMEKIDAALANPKLTPAQRTMITEDRRAVGMLFDGLLGEITHAHAAKIDDAFRGWSAFEGIMNNLVSASMLGSSVFSQMADVATMFMAATNHRALFEAVWNQPAIKRELLELAEKEPELLIYVQGLTATIDGRIANVVGEEFAKATPGSTLRRVQLIANTLAQVQMKANLMNLMTRWQQRTFGNMVVVQLERDLANWANVPEQVKTVYARRGISANEAEQMRVLLDKHHHVIGERWKAPDTAAWARERPDLLAKYKKMLDTAQEEATITADIGDRPFIRHIPMGKMLTGLLGYAFASSDRYILPMAQRFQMSPRDVTPYLSVLMGLHMGIFSDFARAATRGQAEEWFKQLEDDEGWRDMYAKGFLRSPMAVAHSGIVSEIAFNSFGRQANDGIESLTGIRPLPQAATRFREGEGFAPLLGPAASMAQRTLRVGQKLADGEWEKAWNQASRMMPVINTFYLQAILNAMQKDQ